jgi:hypothetical protein
MERFLMGLVAGGPAEASRATVERLSPERRALLLERVRKRGENASPQRRKDAE